MVLILIVAIASLLAALTFTLALRVNRALRSVPQVTKTAQAYLMLQAARVYLQGRWLDGSLAGQAALRVQGAGPNPAQENLFVVTPSTNIQTASQYWKLSNIPTSTTFEFGARQTFPPAALQGAGWFGFTVHDAGVVAGDPPRTFAVVGVGGAGFKAASAQSSATVDADRGLGDVRLYAVYDPAQDRFDPATAGFSPQGGAGTPPSWMSLLPPR